MKKNSYTTGSGGLARRMMILTASMLLGLFVSTSVSAQLTGTKNVPGDYATLALAITDLNTQGVGAGGVTINLISGNAQTAPASGYVIGSVGAGSAVLTTASASNTITIQGNGNTITAGVQAAGGLVDGIFKLIGADYVTITGFVMQENASNTVVATGATNTMTEFGVALLYSTTTDGAKNNTIQGNTISLNRTFPNSFGIYSSVRHSPTAPASAADITSAAGSNSNNKVYGNTISNVAQPITFVGSGTAANMDSGNDIGGTSSGQGNTMTNWGISGTTTLTGYISVSGTIYGIYCNHQTGLNVSYNTLTSATLVATATTTRGIVMDFATAAPSGTFTNTISNNTITLSNSAATSGAHQGIATAGTGLATMNLNISSNTIAGVTFTGAATGAVTGILNAIAAGPLVINSNVVKGIVMNGASGAVTGISNTGAISTSVNMNSNSCGVSGTNFVTFNIASSGAVTGVSQTGTCLATTLNLQNNDVRGITQTAVGSGAQTYFAMTGATATNAVATVSGNTLTNLSINTTGTILFINHGYSIPTTGQLIINNNSIVTAFNKAGASGNVTFTTSNSTSGTGSINNYTNNNFSNITVAGSSSITGFNNTDGGTGSTKTITGNTFNNWTVATGTVNAMNFTYWNGVSSLSSNTITNITGQGAITAVTMGSASSAATSVTVNGNTITGLTSNTTGGTVTGITCSNTSTAITFSNNTIGTFSSIGAASTVVGINITAATATTASGNTISGLSSTGASGIVQGISVTSGTAVTLSGNNINTLSATGATAAFVRAVSITGGTTVNVAKNKIYGISHTAANGVVNAVYVLSATTANVYNNRIGGLTNAAGTTTASATTGGNVVGISYESVTAAQVLNLYHNTIYINGALGVAGSATGVWHKSTTAAQSTLRMNSNIVVSTVSDANSFAVRRGLAGATNYSSSSNNNFYFGGSGSQLWTVSGGSSYGSISALSTALGSSIDGSSVYEAAFTPGSYFQSTTGSASTFLQMVGAQSTQIESGASALASLSITISDDFDGDARPNNAVTLKADIGADEYTGTSPAPVISSVSSNIGYTSQCSATARVITADVVPTGGTLTSATLNYAFNGTAQTPITMTNTSGSTYTATIPAATPTNATVTWSISAVNSLPITTTYTGTSYSDDPLSGTTSAATATNAAVCSGNSTTLSAYLAKAGQNATVGTGTSVNSTTGYPTLVGNYWYQTWQQYIFTPAELQAAGLRAGNITALTLTINALQSSVVWPSDYTVKIGNSASATATTSFQTTGLTTVYGPTTPSFAVGANTINLTTPYNWDGTSNIVIDFRMTEAFGSANATTRYTATTGNSVVYAYSTSSNTSFWTSSPIGTATTTRPNIIFKGVGAVTLSGTSWSDGVSTIGATNSLTISPTSATTVVNTYTATMTYLGCPATASTNVTVNALPTAPTMTAGSHCGMGAVTAAVASGDAVNGSGVFKWYTASTGGTLLYTSGTGVLTYGGANTNASATYWVSEVGTNGCESARASVAETVATPDAIIAHATPTGLCLGATLDLSVTQSGSTGNTYAFTWSATNASTSGIPTGATGGYATPITITPTAAGTYTYTVSAVDGPCTATPSNVIVIVNPNPTIVTATATPNPVCAETSVALHGGSTVSTVISGTNNTTQSTTGLSPFAQFYWGQRSQYLYLQSDLNASGVTLGYITSMAFNITSATTTNNYATYQIKISTTASTALSTTAFISTTTPVTVYSGSFNPNGLTGWQTFNFTTPYNWTGSNIVVEICAFTGSGYTSNVPVRATTKSYNSVFGYYQDTNSLCGLTGASYNSGTALPDVQWTVDQTALYSWTWTDGTTTSTPSADGNATMTPHNATASDISVNYTATATNSTTTCYSTQVVPVTVKTIPTAPSATVGNQCGGGVSPALATSTSASGTGTFNWYSASTGGTAIISDATGLYNVSIGSTTTRYVSESGTNGCESTRTPVTMNVSFGDALAASASAAPLCLGAGSVLSVAQSGGNGNAYTFTWSCSTVGAGLPGTVTGSSITVTPTAAGTYVYTVTGYDGVCTATSTTTIVVNPLPAPVASASPLFICSGNPTTVSTSIGGGISSAVTGTGTSTTSSFGYPTAFGNYWYQTWQQYMVTAAEMSALGLTAGNITSIAFNITALPSPNTPLTDYTVMLGTTGASAMSTTFQTTGLTTVYGPSAPSVAVGLNTLTLSTPWFWDGTSNIVVDLRMTEFFGNANATTVYTTTGYNSVRYAYTTSSNASFWTTAPTATVTNTRPNMTIGMDPNAGYTFSWTPTGGTAASFTANPTLTTTYTVTATKTSTGCQNTASTIVTIAPLAVSVASSVPSACVGTPFNLTATVSGGGAPFTYAYYQGTFPGTLLGSNTTGVYTVTPSASGSTSYYVSATDGCGNPPSTSSAISVSVLASPSITITPSNGGVICAGSGGSVTMTASGASTYAWLPATGLDNAAIAAPTATVTSNSSYTVTGTDAFGCTSTATQAITIGAVPSLTVTQDASLVCTGASVNFTAQGAYPAGYTVSSISPSVTATPGSGVTTLATGGTATTTQTSASLDDGYWTVTLPFTFNYYGTSMTTASIGTNGNIMFATPYTTGYSAAYPSTGAKATFAAFHSDLNTNVGTVNYFTTGTAPNRVMVINWTGVNYYSATPAVTVQAKIYETTGVMESHITSATSSNSYVIGVDNIAGTSATTASGRNSVTTAISSPEAWRFTPIPVAYTYAWTGSGSSYLNSTSSATPIASGIPAGTTTYTATATANYCTSAPQTLTVQAGVPLTASVSPSSTSVCQGTTVNLMATPAGGGAPFNYSWSDGSTVVGTTNPLSIVAPAGTTTTYTVTITDACGGSTTATASITTDNPQPTSVVGDAICGPKTATVTAAATNGINIWDASTSGNLLSVASPYTTPVLSATTTYYVAANSTPSTLTGGGRTTMVNYGSLTPSGYGMVFNATTPLTINSVDVYSKGGTAITLSLQNSSGTTLISQAFTGLTAGTTGSPVMSTLNLTGFTVTPGTGYRLIASGNGGFNYEYNFPAVGFPYALGSLGSITAGYFFGATTSYNMFFYNWSVTGSSCQGVRVPAVVTYTAPPAISATAVSATICQNDNAALSVSSANAYTYSWTALPSATVVATGSTYSPAPMSTTTYRVSAIDALLCATSADVTITVKPTPVATASISGFNPACEGQTATLTANSSTLLPILTQDFNGSFASTGWTTQHVLTTGNVSPAYWTTQADGYVYSGTGNTFHSNDNSQFVISNSDATGSGVHIQERLISPAFSTVGATIVQMTYYRHLRIPSTTYNYNTLVSTNGGTTWTLFSPLNNQTVGTSTGFTLATLDLSAYAGLPSVMVAFEHEATWGYYVAIDNFTISANLGAVAITGPNSFSSTSTVNTLSNLTVANGGTYIATASYNGCSSTASVNLTVNPTPVVTVTGPSDVCEFSSVNPTVTLNSSTTGGPFAVTQWVWNGNIQQVASNTSATTDSYTYNQAGTYTFNATNSFGCAGSASQVVALTTYSLTINNGANGSTSVQFGGATGIPCGATRGFLVTPAACYEVDAILVDGVALVDAPGTGGYSYTFTNYSQNHTVDVTFRRKVYTVTVNVNVIGGASATYDVTVGANSVLCGDAFAMNITPAACSFVQNVTVSGGIGSLGSVTSVSIPNVATNYTVSITLNDIYYTVTTAVIGGGTISPGSGSHLCGSTPSYTITANIGNNISGVTFQPTVGAAIPFGVTNSVTLPALTQGGTLTATFAPGPYNNDWPGYYNLVVPQFPSCFLTAGNLSGSTASPNTSYVTGVAGGSGQDTWYRFVMPAAATTGVARITVNSSVDDIAIVLQQDNGSAASAYTPVAIENSVSGIGAEIMNISGLTPGQSYRVAVKNMGLQTAGAFTICVNYIRANTCGTITTPTSTKSLCDLFLGAYTGAATYVFTFTNQASALESFTKTLSGSGSAASSTAVSLNSIPGLRYGSTYNVKIDATYALPNGAGTINTITIPGSTSTCVLYMSAQPNTELAFADRCGNGPAKVGTSFIGTDWVCGAVDYEWEIAPVSSPTSTTTTIRGAATRFIRVGSLNGISGSGQTSFLVRVRPYFANGSGGFNAGAWSSTARTLCLASAIAMPLAPTTEEVIGAELGSTREASTDATIQAALYPNPNNGEMVNLNIAGIDTDNMQVRIIDGMGRVIMTKRYTVKGSLNTVIEFNSPLASGLYMVECIFNGETRTQRMMVQR